MTNYVTVSTAEGLCRGIAGPGGAAFLGLSYAAAPVGSGRFAPPMPLGHWDGVRDALVFRPAAPQVDSRLGTGANDGLLALLYQGDGSATEGFGISEDCLYLNIWSPGLPTADDAGRAGKPVMVWLHGGAFQAGCGNEAAVRGDQLARTEDVVVVTVTHRLGVLGFSAFDAEPGSGVAGLADIVAALQWIARNIGAFGGDPDNVTLFGQSGGGMKTLALMSMPSAQGLFHKAIVQSGPLLAVVPRQESVENGQRLLGLCGVRNLAELRELPLDAIMAAQTGLNASLDVVGSELIERFEAGMWPGPCVEPGWLEEPLLGAGLPPGATVPLLIGSNTHDMSLMLSADPAYGQGGRAGANRLLERICPPALEAYRQLLSSQAERDPHLALARAVSDLTFRAGSLRIADRYVDGTGRPPVWVYRFDQPTDVWEGLLGACHSVELAYVFGTVDRIPFVGHPPARAEVCRLTMAAWAGFARTGNPQVSGLPPWPAWRVDDRRTMVLGAAPALEEAPAWLAK